MIGTFVGAAAGALQGGLIGGMSEATNQVMSDLRSRHNGSNSSDEGEGSETSTDVETPVRQAEAVLLFGEQWTYWLTVVVLAVCAGVLIEALLWSTGLDRSLGPWLSGTVGVLTVIAVAGRRGRHRGGGSSDVDTGADD